MCRFLTSDPQCGLTTEPLISKHWAGCGHRRSQLPPEAGPENPALSQRRHGAGGGGQPVAVAQEGERDRGSARKRPVAAGLPRAGMVGRRSLSQHLKRNAAVRRWPGRSGSESRRPGLSRPSQPTVSRGGPGPPRRGGCRRPFPATPRQRDRSAQTATAGSRAPRCSRDLQQGVMTVEDRQMDPPVGQAHAADGYVFTGDAERSPVPTPPSRSGGSAEAAGLGPARWSRCSTCDSVGDPPRAAWYRATRCQTSSCTPGEATFRAARTLADAWAGPPLQRG